MEIAHGNDLKLIAVFIESIKFDYWAQVNSSEIKENILIFEPAGGGPGEGYGPLQPSLHLNLTTKAVSEWLI